MKAVILAGGLGTRLSEETTLRPKPMVEIGGQPILWHILKLYSQQGINDFIVCLGYKGYIIKEYFANYFLHTSDVTFDIAHNKMTVHDSITEPWSVTLVDTGDDSGTGGRLRRVAKYLEGEDAFCMTYGDGLSDVDIQATIAFHKAHGKLVTLTSVQPVARFGALGLKNTQVYAFQREAQGRGRMDQRRLLRPLAQGHRRGQGRPLDVRARTHRGAGRSRRGAGLPPPRLLAGHGHPARQAAARRTVGLRQGPLEVLVSGVLPPFNLQKASPPHPRPSHSPFPA